MNTKFAVVPLAFLFAAFVAFGGEMALAAQPACGDVIVADTELEGNLDCPPFTHGLIIGAHGITLDLNGFTISGAQAGAGVLNYGYYNVTVKNGAINGFRDGVRAFQVHGLILDGLALYSQRYSSIVIIDARDVRVSEIFVSLPPGGGDPDPVTGHVAEAIRLAQVRDGIVANVLVEGGYFGVLSIGEAHPSRDIVIVDSYFDDVQTGIRIVDNVNVRVGNNRVTGTEYGEGCYSGIDIVEQASHHIRLQDNIVRGCSQGIFVASDVPSTDLAIWDNLAYANGIGIVLLNVEDSNLTGNEANLNDFAGLVLAENSFDNRISANTATDNGLVDMFHDESSTPNNWTANTCGTSDGADIDCP